MAKESFQANLKDRMLKENFAGYVLAGGKSSRMQKNKAFLEIGGETFLARAVKTLSAVCEKPIRVVLKRQQHYMTDRFPENAKAVYDSLDFDGPLDGLHTALMDCFTRKKEYAVVLAVDLPFVTGEVIEVLAETIESTDEFAALVPVQTDGRIQPLCAVYAADSCYHSLNEFISANQNASLKDFLKTIPVRYIAQNKLPNNNAEDIFFNVNYPADFQSLK